MSAFTCPCGSELSYSNCCQKFIEQSKKPATAEELMRSRYVAFTLKNIDYLEQSTHPKKREDMDFEASRVWAESSDWQSLEIVKTEEGQDGDKQGVVEFIASYLKNDEAHKHHEVASFKFYKNQWFYCDGKYPEQKTVEKQLEKVGRNEPCPCGSGKKYKKCCLL